MAKDLRITLVYNNMPALDASSRRLAGQVVAKAAMDIEGHVKKSMEGPKHGSMYVLPWGAMHVASAPGEAPGIVTGALHNATRAIPKKEMEWWVVMDTEYSMHLEFGTRKMAARPSLGPAVEYVKPSFMQAMGTICSGAGRMR